jgi:DNA-binding HxlR family transcriptional regulator
VLGRTYPNETCSGARALEVVGERWSLLILRDAIFRGTTRFTDFQQALGLAPNVLQSRLELFVEAGLMTQHGREYRLTESGRDLTSVYVTLTQWGDRWVPHPQGPPIRYEHIGCGGALHDGMVCSACHHMVEPDGVQAVPLEAGQPRTRRGSRRSAGQSPPSPSMPR